MVNSAAVGESLNWTTSFDDAKKAAIKLKRPILMYFGNDSDGFC